MVANGTTLNPGDNLVGGAGEDKLAISISGTNTDPLTTSAVTLSSIETVSVSNYDTSDDANTIDLSLASDVTTVALFASSATGDTTISGIQSVVAAQMSNGSGDLTLTYADAAVTGTTDIQTLQLSAVTAGTFVVAGATTGGVETLAITSSGSARNVLTGVTDDTNTTTITVAGTQALTLGTVGVSVTTLDASSNSGGLTATLSTLVDQTVTGSSGNDVITAGTNLTGTDAAVNAGDGTDTLVVTADAVIAVAADGARFTNFEALTISSTQTAALADDWTDRSQDLSLISGITTIGLSTLALTGAAGDNTANTTLATSFTNVGSAVTDLAISGLSYTDDATADDDVALTVSAALEVNTSADALTVTLGTSTAGLGTALAVADDNDLAADDQLSLNLTLNDRESLTIVSKGAANIVDVLNATAMTSLTLQGSKALTIDEINATSLATIDASAMTAAFVMNNATLADANDSAVASTISGGTGNDSLVGGSAADNIAGNAGNDSISGAAGADVITGGAGNDTIDAGAGVDDISGGTGNDTIFVTTVGDFTNLASAEVVSGGDGNDNLSFDTGAVTTLVATDLTGISGVETITIDGAGNAGSITLTDAVYTANGSTSLAIVDGDLETAGGTLTVDASALTSANSVTVTANTDTMSDSLVGGAGNDTFIFAGAVGLELGDTVNGGKGTDTISVDASAAATLVMTAVTNIEQITTTGNGTDEITITVIDENITTAVAATTTVAATAVGSMTLDASSLTNGTGAVNYDGSDVDTITKIQNLTGSAGADTLIGGSGNDIISGGAVGDTITGGIGIDSLSGGTGDDTFTIGTSAQFVGLTTVETVSGGTGNDTLAVTVAALGTIAIAASDLLGISSIETISFSNGGTAGSVTLSDAVFTANGATTLAVTNAAASTVAISVDASALTSANSVQLTGSTAAALNDTLIGGSGNDTFTFTTTAVGPISTPLTATDVVTGGAGTDTLVIATGTAVLTALTLTNVTAIEKITVTGTTGGVGLITLADANFAAITAATISATSLTTGDLLVTAAAEDDSTFSITGGAGDDSIIGGQLADTISGGSGADTITGGLAADSLSGGAGVDQFVYALVTQSNSTNTDSITDFVTGTDKLAVTLDYSGFSSALTVNATVLTAAAGTTAAQDGLSGARGEVIYDTTNSALIINFNADNLVTSSDYKILVNAASTPANSIAEGDINFTITAGSGADTITAGGGADTIRGGAGADAITAGAGNDLIIYAAADTGAVTSTTIATPGTLGATEAFTFTASTLDTITGFATGDTIQFYSTGTTAITTSGVVVVAGGVIPSATTGGVAVIRGTQTNSTTFTAATAGVDSLLIWDIDGTGAGTAYGAVVLVGYTGVANDTVSVGGLYTAVV